MTPTALLWLAMTGAHAQDDGFVGPWDALPDAPEPGPPLDAPREPPMAPPGPPALETIALFLPRVVLLPAWFAAEYGIRRPLGAVATWAERHRVHERVPRGIAFRDGRGRITPVVQFTSGFSPSFGARVRYDGLFTEDLQAEAVLAGNFGHNSVAGLGAGWTIGDAVLLDAWVGYTRRDDRAFFGVGPQVGEREDSRFFRRETMARVGAELTPSDPWLVSLHVDGVRAGFGCNDDDDDLCGPDHRAGTDDDRVRVTDDDVWFDLDGTYDLARMGVVAAFDTRPGVGVGPGVRLDAALHGAAGNADAPDAALALVRYGLEASGFARIGSVDRRLIGLRVATAFADPVGDARIPFPELVTLGGVETMRGFAPGRFHGRSGLVGTVDYRYPVWAHADGSVFVEVGNTFDAHLGGLTPGTLRGVVGVGLRSFDVPFLDDEIVVNLAVGTDAFSDGLGVDAVRLNLGTHRGF